MRSLVTCGGGVYGATKLAVLAPSQTMVARQDGWHTGWVTRGVQEDSPLQMWEEAFTLWLPERGSMPIQVLVVRKPRLGRAVVAAAGTLGDLGTGWGVRKPLNNRV